MKDLNLFRKSARGSEGSMLASTVVRPSFDRRDWRLKHIAFMLLFLLGGFGQMWGANYAKTAAGSVKTGDVVIITYDNGKLYAMTNDKGTSSAPGASELTATNDVITTEATNILWDVTVSDGSFTFKPHADESNALYCTNTNNGVRVGTNANNAFTVDAESGYLINTATSRYVGCYNSQDFRCYTSINSNIKDQTPAFYVLQEDGGDTPSTPTCATPTFDPEDGETFDESISVELATTTDGATIYYTTNGTTPTTSSDVYSSALHFTETTTVKAIAVKDGSNNSAVASATYTKVEAASGYSIDFESAANAYTDWTFTNLVSQQSASGVGTHGGNYYGGTNGKASGSIVTKQKVANPGTITFYVSKESTNSTASSWLIKVSSDGETWTQVGDAQSASAGITKGTWTEVARDLSSYSNVYVGVFYDGTTAKRCIDDIELAMASAVAKPSITGTDNFLTSSEISMACTTEGADVYYTTDGSDPKTSGTKYTAAFSIEETKTIKAIAKVGEEWSAVAEATFTKATVMTVAQALEASVGANQYVKGIVSEIEEVSTDHGNATYLLKDEGQTNSIKIYRGKYLNDANFTAADQIIVGDEVTVFGTVSQYQSKNQFAQGNYIVAIKPAARLAWSAESYDAELGGSNSFPTLTNTSSVAITYSSSDENVATIAANGEITLKAVGTTTITAAFAGNESYKANSVSYTLNVAAAVIRADISFNVDGGSAVEALTDQSALPNPLPTTTKAGKNFGGWYTDAEKTVAAVAGAAVTSTDAITLYAKWLDPYTVAEARAAIDASEGVTGVYATGIVSEIVTAYSSQNGNISYNISADGTTTADQLQAYKGKAAGGANFTSADDVQVGDIVVVYGNLKKYNSIYEFDSNNQLYSLSRPEVAVTSVELAATATVKVGKTINLSASVLPANATNQGITWSVESGSDKITFDNGSVTGVAVGTAVIRATSAADNTKYAECTVTIVAADPVYAYYNYEKVTATSGIEDGEYLIVYEDESLAFNGGLETLDASGNTISVTIEEGVIAANETTNAAAFTINVTDGTILSASGKYIGKTANANGLDAGNTAYTNTFAITDGYAVITASGGTTLRYNKANDQARFRYYKSGQQAIQLYKKVGTNEAPKANAELAWDPAEDMVLTVGDAFTAPTLTNPNNIAANEIEITSSNTELATVSEGVVSLVKDATGEATITATFAGNESYKPASVSYKITVNAAATPAVSGNVVILAEYGGKYYAMTNTLDNGALAGVEVEKDGDKIVVSSDADKAAIQWTATVVGENTTLMDAENKYITGSNGASLSLEEEAYNWNWDGDKSCYISSSYTSRGLFFSSTGNVFKGYAISNLTSDGYAATEVIAIAAENIVVVEPIKHIVSYNANGGLLIEGEEVIANAEVAEGAIVTVAANVYEKDGFMFAGWKYGENVYNAGETFTMPTENVELVAQWNEIVVSDYVLVTDVAQLQAGDKIIIVASVADKAAGSAASTYRNVVDIQRTSDKSHLIFGETMPTEFVLGVSGGKFTFKDGDKYMYESAVKSVKLQDEAFEWSIAIGEGNIATITATNGDLKYNASSPRFTTYASGQQALQLYRKPAPEPEYTTVRSGLTAGRHYTICQNKKIVAVKGATFWSLSNRDEAGTTAYLVEASLPLTAGAPYIFQATADKLEVIYEGDEVGAPVENGALRGTFSSMNQAAIDDVASTTGSDIYMLKNNELRKANGQTGNTMGAYKAYVVYNALSIGEPAHIQGRRVKTMPMAPQVATGVESIQTSEIRNQKVLINGQLFILRGEKMYNANGQLVK